MLTLLLVSLVVLLIGVALGIASAIKVDKGLFILAALATLLGTWGTVIWVIIRVGQLIW